MLSSRLSEKREVYSQQDEEEEQAIRIVFPYVSIHIWEERTWRVFVNPLTLDACLTISCAYSYVCRSSPSATRSTPYGVLYRVKALPMPPRTPVENQLASQSDLPSLDRLFLIRLCVPGRLQTPTPWGRHIESLDGMSEPEPGLPGKAGHRRGSITHICMCKQCVFSGDRPYPVRST